MRTTWHTPELWTVLHKSTTSRESGLCKVVRPSITETWLTHSHSVLLLKRAPCLPHALHTRCVALSRSKTTLSNGPA